MQIIKATNLTKQYSFVKAVDNVNLTIEQGEVVGLVGKNGSGKTTLIKLLSNVALPTFGTVERFDLDNPTDVSAIIESPALYKNLTARQNMKIRCKLLGLPHDQQYVDKTLELVGLFAKNKNKVEDYSLGMQQRLAIALCLLGRPKFLLLDEPINGLDPQGIKEVRELVQNLSASGVAILISSHILSELSQIATRYVFIDKGRIIKEMTQEQFEKINCGRMRLVTNQAGLAFSVLKEQGFDAQLVDAKVVEVATVMNVTDLIVLMSQHDVKIDTVSVAKPSLEDFYLRLLNGGDDNG